jgi:hypothetical protein
MILKYGASAAFDMTYLLTKPFTNRGYYDEIQGLSDSLGVSLKKIRGIHLIGELT